MFLPAGKKCEQEHLYFHRVGDKTKPLSSLNHLRPMILDDIQTPFEHFKLTSKLMIRNVCWYTWTQEEGYQR
jgi:hypothetical protein